MDLFLEHLQKQSFFFFGGYRLLGLFRHTTNPPVISGSCSWFSIWISRVSKYLCIMSSHLKRGRLRGYFPSGFSVITICNSEFWQCQLWPAHFNLLLLTVFSILDSWKSSFHSLLSLIFHLFIFLSFTGLKIFLRISL